MTLRGRRPVNPVLARELRQRMRGPRAAVVLTVYLGLLVLILQLLYAAAASVGRFDAPAVEDTAAVGRSIFQTLLFFVLLLVCFIVPSVTGAAISGERERQTLVPLQVTLLRPRSVLVGKLLASLAFVVLLVTATLPLASVTFLLGGVEPLEVIRVTAMVLVVAVTLAAVSLLCSTFMRSTSGAIVVALSLMFGLCVGTFMVYGAQRILDRGSGATSQMVLVPNPFMAVADVLDRRPDGFDGGSGSPFTPMQHLIRERDHPPGRFVGLSGEVGFIEGAEGFGPGARQNPQAQDPPLVHRVPLWMESLVFYALLSLGALALAARRLSVPRAVL